MMHLGASNVTLEAMTGFSNNYRIVEHCCGVIRNLAALRINSYGLMRQRAAKTLVNCLSLPKHKKNGRVQRIGCLAIWALSLWEDNKVELIEQGVGELMVSLLKRFRADLSVFENAVGVVANLSTVEPNAIHLFQAGVAMAVINGVHSHKNSESVQARSICALKNISYWSDEYAFYFRDRGAGILVEEAIGNFPFNDSIHKQGSELLLRLGNNQNVTSFN